MSKSDPSGGIDDLHELLTAMILDTRTRIEDVNSAVRKLKEDGRLDFRRLRELALPIRTILLRGVGISLARTKAPYFDQDLPDLRTATYEDMLRIKGIGPKLASLWMRVVHGRPYVVVDAHVLRWLKRRGYGTFKRYDHAVHAFKVECEELGRLPHQFDAYVTLVGILKRGGCVDEDYAGRLTSRKLKVALY